MKGFFWPRVETRPLIALFFLRFGTPDWDSKLWKYLVFIRYHWASAGMTKGIRLSKRKRNVLRHDDYFYFHHCSFQICITDQAWRQYDWIYGQITFLHFVRLSRSPLFFPYAKRLRRSFFRCRTSCIEARLRSLLRTYERSTCSKSSILFAETKSRPMRKERRQYPAIVTEEAWSIKDIFYGQIIVVLIHNGLSCRYLVFYEQADTDLYFSRLPFPASFAWTLNVPIVHCAILSLAVAFSVLQTLLRWDA